MDNIDCIDLCSGLGGFSQAFVDRGHNVIRIDNNPKFSNVPHTRIADVKDFRSIFKKGKNPTIMLIAPDCTHLSLASAHKNWKKGIPQNQRTVQSLRLVFWCLDAVDYLGPKYWILENPSGMLNKILGPPDVKTYFASWGINILKPTDLWGDIPDGIDWKKPKNWDNWSKAPKKPEDRARIPYELSLAICKAVEESLLSR